MALKVGELYALFGLDTSGVTSALTGISTHLTSLGNEFVQAGVLWSNAISVPIKNAFGDAIETGMNFNAEMAKATTKANIDLNTDEGQAAYKALRDEAFRVAKQSVYTSEQVAGAYDKMAMAGWEWEAMVGGLEPIMDLAAASGEDVVTVSDIVTDAMTAYGLTLEKAGGDIQTFQGYVQHFSDVLAAAATSSNTDVAMMGESFKYAASMMGAMAYSVDDTAIALGLMANRGIKSSQAGTSLRRILGNLVNPSEKVQFAIEAVGLKLHDGEGNMVSFMDVMKQMRTQFNSLGMSLEARNGAADLLDKFYKKDEVEAYVDSLIELEKEYGDAAEDYMDPSILEAYKKAVDELSSAFEDILVDVEDLPEALVKMQYAAEIAGARGLPALLSIITSSEEEFQGLTDAIYGSEGRTHGMKESMLDNAKGDLEMFKSSIDILKVSIEELVDDKLRSLLQTSTEVIDKFIGMDDETKETILKMAGIAAAIGPALVGFGTLLKLLPAIGSALSFIATPLGLVTVLLGGLALAAMDSDGKISKAFGEMKEAFGLEDFDFNIQDALEGINIDEMLDGLLGSVSDLANSDAVQGFMKRLGEGLSGALGALGDIVGDLIGYLLSPEGIEKIFDAGISIAKLLLSGVGYAIKGASDFIGGIVSSILDKLGIIDKDAMKNELNVGETLSDAIASSITDSSGEIRHNAESAFATILAAFAAGESDAFENMIEGTEIEDIYQQIMMAVFEHSNTSGFTGDKALLQQIFENAFASSDLDFGPILQKLPDNFWDIAYESITGNANKGEGKPLLDLLLESMLGDGISSSVEQSLQEKDTALAAAVESSGLPKTKTALATSLDEASREATEAMQGTFSNDKEPVSNAAAEISDEVVKKFLMTMSAENGASIASGFSGAILAGITEGGANIQAASETAATSVKTVFSSILNHDNGYTIGLNFSFGIADGILDGKSDIINAAVEAANAAIDASKETLDINSPSGVGRREVGIMWDRGIAVGMINGVKYITSAAEEVADAMHDQFMVSDMSRGTVYTARHAAQQTAEQTALATEGQNRLDPRAIGQAMAEYMLEHGGGKIDIYLDSEKVGGGVANPVSIAIAELANAGRPEFV